MTSRIAQRPETMVFFQLLCFLLAVASSMAATCPHPCTCTDEQNLNVNCSGKHLMTLPTTSTSTLTLDLSDNGLGPIINASFARMPNLTVIDLSQNAITRLLGCTLTGMLALKTVRLHRNRLTSLPDSLFTDANKVEHLDISHNLFTELPDDTFRNLPQLKTLDISHNQIVELVLGPRFQVPRHIEMIDLSHNHFETIQQNAFEMAIRWEVGIDRTINLAYCRISSIEAGAFSNIPNLHDLDISGNTAVSLDNVTALVKELETRGLERLSLAHMNLTTLEPLFTQVTHMSLKYLNVSFNSIGEIPANVFSTIRSLRVLDLSHNSVLELDDGFSDLVNIKVLNVSHNRMGTFQGDAVNQLTNLHTLDISHNRLADPGNFDLSPLINLNYLNVNNNLLSSLVVPSNTSNLRYLDYHSNSIAEFTGLDDATSLEFFDISDNDIEKVAGFLFKGAKFLKIANFSRNSITALDHRAFLPQSPLVIDLSDNFLRELRFSNWVATQKLLLNNNNLSHVDSQAFYGMVGLSDLDLSENKLTMFHEDLMEYLTSLKHLNLSHNGLDKVSWFFLFRNLESLETLDLGYNNISQLNEDMLLPLPKIQELCLRNNNLRSIIPRVFRDLTKIELIDLSNNPLDCTCDMLAFRDWLIRTKIPILGLYTINSTAYQCHAPPHRAGVHVTKWGPQEFECNRSMLYLIIFGSIGIFLIVAGVAGSAAYRFYRNWKRKREERRKLEEERYERKHRLKKADHVRMTSREIAEEIQDAMERKERHGRREYDVKDRANGYVPWPGGARRLHDEERERRISEERDRAVSAERKERIEKERHRGRHYDRLKQDDWAIEAMDERRRGGRDERRHRSPEQDEVRDRHRRTNEGERHRRRREGDYVNIGRYSPERSHGRVPTRYEDYIRDGRMDRHRDLASYYDRDRRYLYFAEPPRGSGPYIVPVPSSYTMPRRWERGDGWDGPRNWTIQGYGRPRDQGQGQGHRMEGYHTMPVGGREMFGHERDVRAREREDDRGLERYPQEVRFEDRAPRRYPNRQGHDAADPRHPHGKRSQSYNYLPQDYAEETPFDRKDRMQREYESIDQARGNSGIGPRAASQPLLTKENTSDWL